MPRYYHGGVLNLPPQIRQLPLNLRHDPRYPRRPDLTAAAVETYGRPVPGTLFPQRMGFQHWRTSQPFQPAWGEDVRSVMQAVAGGQATIAELGSVGIPDDVLLSEEDYVAREQLNELPSDPIDPSIYGVPLARNALPNERILLNSADLAQYGRARMEQEFGTGAARVLRREQALSEVYAQQDAIGGELMPSPELLPWFLR